MDIEKNEINYSFGGGEQCPKCFSESSYWDESLRCYICVNCGHEFN